MLLDLKLIQKHSDQKVKNMKTDTYMNGTELSPEMCKQLIQDKEAMNIQRKISSINGAWKTGQPHAKE